MIIHILQHVHFETPGYILDWAKDRQIEISYTRFFEDASLPNIDEIDGLVVMGGPMGVYDEDRIPWLADEKVFIKACIEKELPILGICLGAQLVAEVLGARVYKHSEQEIGWFPVDLMHAPGQFSRLTVFHWHGDTYELPEGAIQIAQSEGCDQQAFIYKHHVLAFQFHLEVGFSELDSMLKHDGEGIGTGKYIQPVHEMREIEPAVIEQNNMVLNEFLGKLFIDVSL